ncbi:MAG: L,D-transpeptidase family protein [Proteobacteria bacterium]|nr:L,D-transpeptidase family protein [Pseudomonadota bacterium]
MIPVITFIFSCFLFIASVVFGAEIMIGGITQYTVQKDDRLELIGAKLGVFWKNIAKENNLDPKAPCVAGQVLKVITRKIVPRIVEDGIIINIADRTLYYFKMGKLTTYPVGVGLAREDDFGDWRTPTGKFVIVGKRKNPTWSVPDSIQLETAFKGKEVEETVPPGPKNPLGRYAVQTSIPGVLIHETIWPASVYRFQSHGCIRMLPENMEIFFEEVGKGTKGEIIYEPVKIMLTQEGKSYLEVRTDTYRRFSSLKDRVWKLIDERGIRDKVDVSKVEQIIKDQSGIAEDITFYPKEGPVTHMMKTLYQRFFDFFKPSSKSEKQSSGFQGNFTLNRSVQNLSSRINLYIVSGCSGLMILT